MTIPAMKTYAGIESIDYYFARHYAQAVDASIRTDAFHLLVALSWHLRQGHTCLPLAEIAGKQLFDDEEQECHGVTFAELTPLIRLARTLAETFEDPQQMVYHRGKLYTARYHDFEQVVAKGVVQRLHARQFTDEDYTRLQKIWRHLFPVTPVLDQDWQQIAVACALTREFAVINGGPGTGKTYTVARLLLALQASSEKALNIKLAAPTGKAAQRLTESVSDSLNGITGADIEPLKARIVTQASTLHRLLGIRPNRVRPRHHSDNPVQCDVLIIDEASMVDLALMARVFRALPDDARVYLVGDANQLPSVESGNVLEALAGNDDDRHLTVPAELAAHVHKLCPHLPGLATDDEQLTTVFSLKVSQRYSGKLAEIAVAVRTGNSDDMLARLTRVSEPVTGLLSLEDVVLMPPPENTDFTKLVKDSFAPLLQATSPASALAAMGQCRWLTPVRNGKESVSELNASVERILQPGKLNGRDIHYTGRPVMVMENDYTQRLFNGDTGVIWPDDNKQLKAWFTDDQGALRAVSLSRLPAVETVYAMTIHKSQGSEFQRVVMWLPEASGKAASLFTRELLYTGLTRAKKGCVMIGHTQRIKEIIAQRATRFSGLQACIEENWHHS